MVTTYHGTAAANAAFFDLRDRFYDILTGDIALAGDVLSTDVSGANRGSGIPAFT
jgi:hypothetical protein